MSDAYSRFWPRRHNDPNAICALCVVQNYRGQRPLVTVYFPTVIYDRLQPLSLRPDFRGRWMMDSTVTTAENIREWLERYDAWDAVLSAENATFGDRPRVGNDWYYRLLEKAS